MQKFVPQLSFCAVAIFAWYRIEVDIRPIENVSDVTADWIDAIENEQNKQQIEPIISALQQRQQKRSAHPELVDYIIREKHAEASDVYQKLMQQSSDVDQLIVQALTVKDSTVSLSALAYLCQLPQQRLLDIHQHALEKQNKQGVFLSIVSFGCLSPDAGKKNIEYYRHYQQDYIQKAVLLADMRLDSLLK